MLVVAARGCSRQLAAACGCSRLLAAARGCSRQLAAAHGGRNLMVGFSPSDKAMMALFFPRWTIYSLSVRHELRGIFYESSLSTREKLTRFNLGLRCIAL